ncbi:MAG: Flp pilus assembly protein CpaB [Myxococcota bacterium]
MADNDNNDLGGLRNRPMIMIAAAVGFGLLAAVLASLYIQARGDAYLRSLAGGEVKEITVVVASRDLGKGTVVSEQYFSVRKMPEGLVHRDAVRPSDFERVKGRILVEDMRGGTPLLGAFLEETFPTDFSDTLKIGRRAVTIQVDELNSIGGLLRSGDTIDLYVLISPAVGAVSQGVTPEGLANLNLADLASNVVLPVLQGVRVLATGEEALEDYQEKLAFRRDAPKSRFSTITVSVTPREGALLAQALDQGDLVSMLRNRDDGVDADFTSVGVTDLFGNARQIAAKAQQARRETLAQGFTVTEDGEVVMADGTILEGATVTESGFIVTEDGTVLTQDGQVIAGATVNENGEVVTATGEVLVADAITIDPETGAVIDKATGETIAGVSATLLADMPDEALAGGGALAQLVGNAVEELGASGVEFLAGGNSEDGIAEVGELPVLD